MLQATLTSREDNSVVFQITVPASQVNTALNRVYQQIAGSQRVNGFRRGKAPREVLNTIFGIESIHSQALQDLLPDAFYEAAAQLNLSPIGAPDFDPFPVIEEGKDMEINVKVDVLPDIHLADYASVNIDMEKEVSVENDELEDALKGMRKRLAEFTDVERAAQANDRVNIDYRIAFTGPEGKDLEEVYDAQMGINLILGDAEVLPDIEENIIGVKAGETKKFIVAYPENYQNKEIAGKSTSVEVTVHKVSERKLPEMNEDFFKKIGSKATDEASFRSELENRLKDYKNQQRQEAVRDAAVAKVVEQTHIDLPDSLIDDEMQDRREYLDGLLSKNGATIEHFLANENMTEEEFNSREREAAKIDVKRRIVLNEIFTKENMEITADEMNIALNNYARMNQLRASDLKKIIRDRAQMDRIRQQIRNAKVVALLVSRVKFKEDWADGAAEPAAAEGETKE